MPATPPPRDEGLTTRTAQPLYWCRYAPVAPRSRMVVLHGGPGAHHDYLLPQLLVLAEERECVFYDQRGGGRSRTDDRAPITWQTHVADLNQVIAELAPGPLTLVGYSWGAMLALLYSIEAAAGRAGPVPTRLILLDPGPVSRQFRSAFEAEFHRRQASAQVVQLRAELTTSGLRERHPAAFKQRAFELSVAGYFADPTRAHDLTPFRVIAKVQQSVWESLGDYDLIPALKGLQIPALVVHGRQDPIPLASARAVAEALGAEAVWLDECGHVPYVEQPDALFSALRAYLTRTESLLTL